jgi:hypothetical protein
LKIVKNIMGSKYIVVRIDWDDQHNSLVGVYNTHDEAVDAALDVFVNMDDTDEIRDREHVMEIIEESGRGNWILDRGVQLDMTLCAIYELE